MVGVVEKTDIFLLNDIFIEIQRSNESLGVTYHYQSTKMATIHTFNLKLRYTTFNYIGH